MIDLKRAEEIFNRAHESRVPNEVIRDLAQLIIENSVIKDQYEELAQSANRPCANFKEGEECFTKQLPDPVWCIPCLIKRSLANNSCVSLESKAIRAMIWRRLKYQPQLQV